MVSMEIVSFGKNLTSASKMFIVLSMRVIKRFFRFLRGCLPVSHRNVGNRLKEAEVQIENINKTLEATRRKVYRNLEAEGAEPSNNGDKEAVELLSSPARPSMMAPGPGDYTKFRTGEPFNY